MRAGELLAAWRQLSLEESKAIDTDSWDRVLELQAQKAGLQKAFEGMPGSVSGSDPEVDPLLVASLMAQETMNLQRVQRRRDAAEPQRAELERSRRDLRRIRNSFGSNQAVSWQHYS